MRILRTCVAAAAAMTMAGAAQAALVDRGGGMIYDTTRNITWLADMNYAFTSGYAAANAGGSGSNQIQPDGGMGWDAANDWANNLIYGGFSDWRLPTINPVDTACSQIWPSGGGFPEQYWGFNCTAGELSGLFATDLGNKAGESVLNQIGDTPQQIANLALFSNVRRDLYWSGTEFAPMQNVAWSYVTNSGYQTFNSKSVQALAVAVRPGDVAATVPEPQTLALALLALGATVLARRRRS